MRLTTRTNLAIRALMFCAVNEGRTARSAEIADAANSSANHLAQVIHVLHVNGYIHATRGRMGGVKLARAARTINIGAVFRLFEADVPFTECAAPETNSCPLVPACRLKGAIRRALEAFYREMDLVTLEDLVKGNFPLEEMLRMADSSQDEPGAQDAPGDLGDLGDPADAADAATQGAGPACPGSEATRAARSA